MNTVPARESVEGRLARAGLPPLPRTAWLEVDLDALRANLDALRSIVGPDVRVEPVVKADAYGHGAVPIALELEAVGADGLSVATLDEAFELRAGGVTLPLLVLYPIPPGLVAEAARQRIAVSIGPGPLATRALAAAGRALRGGTPDETLDVHLELETGLGRGGVLPDAVGSAIEAVRQAPGVRLAGVWTHLAASEDPPNAHAQDGRFSEALASVIDDLAWGPAAVRRHLAGSGGVLGGDVARWDAVRIGLAIYGLVPDTLTPASTIAAAAGSLRPAMALVARAVRVVELPAGHGISYGPTFVTSRPSRIATLPLGYGDGWKRALSDRSYALVRGIRVPLVGRVAMDAVMADVTDVPGAPITEDEEFVLLGSQGGQQIGARELAVAAGTISYDIVTSMARRLPRVYHAAGSPVGVRTLADGRSA